MNEETRIAKLGNLPGEQFDTLGAVAEDDCLRNVKFGEESVQTVELLLLLEVGVKLSETFQGQLVSQPDELGIGHVFGLEVADLGGVSSTEHQDLLLSHKINDLLHDVPEVVGQ